MINDYCERPIIFSGDMVRAILERRKTQTRRVVKGVPNLPLDVNKSKLVHDYVIPACPYGKDGDRLWVRENLSRCSVVNSSPWRYDADRNPIELRADDPNVAAMVSWAHHKERPVCPSIHMPRWASRLTLEIVSVRVERLQEISENDALSEGLTAEEFLGKPHYQLYGEFENLNQWTSDPFFVFQQWTSDPYFAFQRLWDSINAKRAPWASNPWVWVLEFRPL